MIDAIMGVLGTIIYPLFGIVFLLIDGIQDIFKAFAGIGDVTLGGKLGGVGGDAGAVNITSGNSGKLTDTGLLYYLFQSSIIRNVFISILVLALFLIIIFTVMAFIKNAYSSKPKKWQDIIGNAFVGLANFVFIPVCCLLGVWLGNILLNAIDGATNYTGATSMSRMLFVSAAYNANEFRQENTDTYNLDSGTEMYNEVTAFIRHLENKYQIEIDIDVESKNWDTNGDESKIEAEKTKVREYYAGIIDQVFAQCEEIEIWQYSDVSEWYQLMSINYVILAGGGIFLIYALASISFGMVKRLFTLLLLFVISPALCALYPLDDGKAVGSWKGDFVKNTISAYGAVAGLNLFFSLIPIVQQINLTGGVGNVLDALGLTSLLLTIAGLYVVKDFISMITGYVGAGDAYGSGAGLMGNVKKRVGGMAKKTGKFATGTSGAFARAKGAMDQAKEGEKFGAFMSSMGRSTWDATKGGIKTFTGFDMGGYKKHIETSYDTGYAARKAKEDKENKGKYKEKESAKRSQAAYDNSLVEVVDGTGTRVKVPTAASAYATYMANNDDVRDAIRKDALTALGSDGLGKLGLQETGTEEQVQSATSIVSTFGGLMANMKKLTETYNRDLSAILDGKSDNNKKKIREAIETGETSQVSDADRDAVTSLISQKFKIETARDQAVERVNTTDSKGNAAMQSFMDDVTATIRTAAESATRGLEVSAKFGTSLEDVVTASGELATKFNAAAQETSTVKKKIADSKRKGKE